MQTNRVTIGLSGTAATLASFVMAAFLFAPPLALAESQSVNTNAERAAQRRGRGDPQAGCGNRTQCCDGSCARCDPRRDPDCCSRRGGVCAAPNASYGQAPGSAPAPWSPPAAAAPPGTEAAPAAPSVVPSAPGTAPGQPPPSGYAPAPTVAPAPGYAPQPGYAPAPAPAYAPQPGYAPAPAPAYAPQPGYAPAPAYAPQPGYAPAPPPPGYAPAPGYAPPATALPPQAAVASDLPPLASISTTLEPLRPAIGACAAGQVGTAAVTLILRGDGVVQNVAISGPFSPPTIACLQRTIGSTRFPTFRAPSTTISLRLPIP